MILKLYLFILCFLLQPAFSHFVTAQDSPISREDVVQRITQFNRYISPQKVYLHMNKSQYYAGEAIWFKAYLIDGINHMADTLPANLYVDMINSNGTVMERRILLAEGGYAEGDIVLPRTLPDGNYKIRAYTNWMRNFGEEFYFTRYMYIRNDSYANMIPRPEVRSNRRFNREIERIARDEHIHFFPEGGYMIEDVFGRVAFKAVDGLGRGVEAEGEIVDENSEVAAVFQTSHNGLGSFDFRPSAGSVYTARVSFGDKRPVSLELPAVQPYGTAMRVEQDDQNITLNIISTILPDDSRCSDEIIAVAHTRGNVVHGETLRLNEGRGGLVVPKNMFPSGIAHITLFSAKAVPLAERLVFINHDDAFVFYPEVTRQTVGDREYYVVNVRVNDKEGKPVDGNFSAAVVTTENLIPPSGDNLVSQLLLSSDLPGIVEQPLEYLYSDEDMSASLDNLMMTHGWRRFAWDNVLAGKTPEIRHMPASSLAITGTALHPSNEQALPNFPIRLKIFRQSKEEEFETSTDPNGGFVFDNLMFHDNVRIRLSSDRKISNTEPEIKFNAGEIQGINYQLNLKTRPLLITSRGQDWSRTAGAGRSPYEHETLKTTAPQQYGVPDQTVYLEPEAKLTNMYDVLVSRLRGLNHNLQFRGPTSVHLSNTPLYMVDGIETSQNAFLSLDPRYVERIEAFNGPRASVFGVRGASGAILAYSRRAGSFIITGYDEYLIQGYHSPREFYPDIVSYQTSPGTEVSERTILWDPSLRTDRSGVITLSVPVTNTSGMIKFVIEGTGSDGGAGSGVFSIQPPR
jgi:hypothetical protein